MILSNKSVRRNGGTGMWDFGWRFRSVGIVISVLLAAAGIFMLCNPFSSARILAWVFIVGLLVYGIWQLACYIRIRRNGWVLAFGLISTGLGLAIVQSIANLYGIRITYSYDGMHHFTVKI